MQTEVQELLSKEMSVSHTKFLKFYSNLPKWVNDFTIHVGKEWLSDIA